jgi:hypothetical protein
LNFLNRQGAKNAKRFFFCLFLIGTDDPEKHNALWAGYLLRLFTMRFMPRQLPEPPSREERKGLYFFLIGASVK